MTLPKARFSRLSLRGKWNKLSAAMQFLILITLLGTVGVSVAYATSLTLSDDEWVGLGASAGRLEFDDQSVDEALILDAYLGVGTEIPTEPLTVREDLAGVANVLQLENFATAAVGNGVSIELKAKSDGCPCLEENIAAIVADVDDDTFTRMRTSLDLQIRHGASGTETGIYIDGSSGSVEVGINDNTPARTLDVAGTFRATGDANFSSDVTIASDLTVDNDLDVITDLDVEGEYVEAIPFVAYTALAPYSSQTDTHIATLDQPGYLEDGFTSGVYVQTTNDASNYWTISVLDAQSTSWASFNTSAMSANVWTLGSDASVSNGLIAPATDKFFFVRVSKTGSPGSLYLSGPVLRFTPDL